MAHAWVDIDLDAVRSNLRALKSILKPWVDVIGMVKGNAYGHGAVEVGRALLSAGASRLGVAFLPEAVELRDRGFDCPIMLLGSYSRSDIDELVALDITPSIWDLDLARELSQAARRRGRRFPVHIDVDTGMGRLGVAAARAPFFLDNIRSLEGIYVEGIFTHLSSADEQDQTYSRIQLHRFESVLERIQDRGVCIPYVHAQNSAGILNLPDVNFQAVRPGLSLYGLYPAFSSRKIDLKPALSFHSRVAQVKRVPAGTFVSYGRTHRTSTECNLATISAGYADGVPRALSSKGRVLIRGRSFPIVGRITMDHFVVDLDQDGSVRMGDRVTLIGRDGDLEISTDEIARDSDTISYEITTGISHRVARSYLGAQAEDPGLRLVARAAGVR